LIKVAATGRRIVNSDRNDPVVRSARVTDWNDIRKLLSDAGLPTDDIGPNLLENFLIAGLDAEIVGLVGLEIYDTKGLLRSLVVTSQSRSIGLGKKLVSALEAAAQAAGIKDLWLLTIDADRYFATLGYIIVARDAVPEAIRSSEEFAELCPDSAHLMMKDLRISES
jgi:amino-acid N-acetyltransferase